MVFGFNTDIKYQDVVYHVQSEVREAERLLQSQIFVRGQCVGKHANSFADRLEADPNFTEQQTHELLKLQHRDVVDAIRTGRLEAMLGKPVNVPRPGGAPAPVTSATAASPADEEAPVAASGSLNVNAPAVTAAPAVLKLEALRAETLAAQNAMLFSFRITADDAAAAGARVTARLDVPGENPVYAQVDATAAGAADIRIPLDRASKPDAVLLVQASYGGKSTTQKFRLRRS